MLVFCIPYAVACVRPMFYPSCWRTDYLHEGPSVSRNTLLGFPFLTVGVHHLSGLDLTYRSYMPLYLPRNCRDLG